MVYINQKYITSDETIQHIIKKMTPPLGKIKKKKKKKKKKILLLIYNKNK